MAQLEVIPDDTNQTAILGAPKTIKVVPKNPDGTIFDCTGFTTILGLRTTAPGAYQLNEVQDLDVSGGATADATGITFTIPFNNVTALCKTYTNMSTIAAQLSAGNGTNLINAWSGLLNLNYNNAGLGVYVNP